MIKNDIVGDFIRLAKTINAILITILLLNNLLY